MTAIIDLFWGAFLMSFQFLAILAGVICAIACVGLVGFYGFCFLRGVYWAATGKPMPPKPSGRVTGQQ